MMKVAFKMKLKKGFEMEYKRRHDNIWPELSKSLKDAGIFDYTIFFNEETLTLFGVQKLKEDNSVEELLGFSLMKKWWDYMADIMETNPDNSPLVVPLTGVFHIQ